MGERRMERETGAGEKKRERETGMGERKIEREEREREREIGRETGVGERERQGRKRKNYKHKKIMQFYLAAERSEARQFVFQSGYQRQGGKENDRKRDGLGEREKDITSGARNGLVPL